MTKSSVFCDVAPHFAIRKGRAASLIAGAVLAAVLAGLPMPAAAQDAGAGRYVLERAGDTIIRLDTLTGEVSKCAEVNNEIACRLAADERNSLDQRITELEDRIAALEARLDKREPGPGKLTPDQPTEPKLDGLPSDEEMDQVFNMMERFMHRFIDVFKDLDDKMEDKPEKAEPVPEKT